VSTASPGDGIEQADESARNGHPQVLQWNLCDGLAYGGSAAR